MGEETEFKNWFRKRFAGWSEVYEPRQGGSSGIPDLQLLVDGNLLSVEMKIGWIRGDRIHVEFEPAQPSWHIRLQRAGGKSLIAVGMKRSSRDKGWDVWAVEPGLWMVEWEKGVPEDHISQWRLWEG